MIFFPLRVYGHRCLGVLFTSSSIRGRGTTVFCVLDLSDPKKMLALKMSWQDLARVSDYNAVMTSLEEGLQEREKEQLPHPNVIVPLKYVILSFIGYGVLTYPQNVQCYEGRSGVQDSGCNQRISPGTARSFGGRKPSAECVYF